MLILALLFAVLSGCIYFGLEIMDDIQVRCKDFS